VTTSRDEGFVADRAMPSCARVTDGGLYCARCRAALAKIEPDPRDAPAERTKDGEV
jgi:hypothetical protein